MSGIGAHACVPVLSRKYRLEEIHFRFSMMIADETKGKNYAIPFFALSRRQRKGCDIQL